MIKVRAISIGIYGDQRRRIGDVFEIEDDAKLGSWICWSARYAGLWPAPFAMFAREKPTARGALTESTGRWTRTTI